MASLVDRRRGMGSYEYTGYIRWIGGVGAQYIDTEIPATESTKLEVGIVDFVISMGAIVGSRYSVSSDKFTIFGNHQGDIDVFGGNVRFSYAQTDVNANAIVGEDAVLKIDGNKFYINGTEVGRSYTRGVNKNLNIYLFGFNNNGSFPNPHATNKLLKISYCKIWDGSGNLQRELLSYMNSGVPCMYDTVSQRYFYNKGEGDFIAGPRAIVNS